MASRRLIRFILVSSLTSSIVIGTASALWYFNEDVYSNENLGSNLMIDNIGENYSFNATEVEDKEYTIYLFPSTIYADVYYDYLSGENTVLPDETFSDTRTETYLPENLFGHIDVSINENGGVVKDPNFTTNSYSNMMKYGYHAYKYGNTYTYNMSESNFIDDRDSYDYAEWNVRSKAYYNERYWNGSGYGRQQYTWMGANQYYHYNPSPISSNNIIDYKKNFFVAGQEGNRPLNDGSRRDFAHLELILEFSKEDDGTDDKNFYKSARKVYLEGEEALASADGANHTYGFGSPNSSFKKIEDIDGNDNALDSLDKSPYARSRFNYRYQSEYDRYGAWDELYYNQGRILPIKLQVKKSNAIEIFQTVLNEFTPVTSMYDKWGWYNYTFSSWTYFDPDSVDNSDDVDNSDSVDNSNNNNYGAPVPVDRSSENISLTMYRNTGLNNIFNIMGNLDDYATTEEGENIIRLFPSYSNGTNYEASLKNSALQGPKNYDLLRVNYTSDIGTKPERYFQFINKDAYTYNGVGNIFYATLSNMYLDNNTKDYTVQDSLITDNKGSHESAWSPYKTLGVSKIVEDYGSGLYNFYIFVGSVGTIEGNVSGSLVGIEKEVTNKSGTFPELYNKNLISFTLDAEYLYVETDSDQRRQVNFCIEKVNEVNIYNSLDLNKEFNEQSATLTPINMINISERLATYTHNNNSFDEQSYNPYRYLAQGVNLGVQRDADGELITHAFQIRLSGSYLNYDIVINNLSSGVIMVRDYNPSKLYGDYAENEKFVNASEYFDLKTHDNEVGKNEKYLCLKEPTIEGTTYQYGYYDILLEISGSTIYVYAYYHSSNFIKVFSTNEYLKNYDEVYDANNTYYNNKISNFDRNEYYGMLDHNYYPLDPNGDGNENDSTLVFNNDLVLGTTLSGYFNSNRIDVIRSKVGNLSSKVLVDYITKQPVIYFDESGNVHYLESNFIFTRNHVYYLEDSTNYIS